MSLLRTLTLSVFMVGALAVIPNSASAASSRVSCELTVTTPYDSAKFKGTEEVLVQKGDEVSIEWKGMNADEAIDIDKDEIDIEDSITISPTKDTEYSYRFTSGSRKADCGVELVVVDASFDEDTLVTENAKPTISGEATDTKSVRLEIKDEKGKLAFKSKVTRVRSGEWDVRVTKSLKDGAYDVTLFGEKGAEIDAIGEGTLIVGDAVPSSTSVKGGTLVMSALPLLSGGNAAPGASIPVAYIKVTNTSDKPAHIDGFTLKQNGSASTDAVVSVSTNDDKGGSRYTTQGAGLFKNGLMYVPLPAVVPPGQIRIYSIKVLLNAMSGNYAGQTLMLDVVSATTGANVPSTFPIQGTTWTLTR